MSRLKDQDVCVMMMLPSEVIQHVFSFLPVETLIICEEVCQYWKVLARDATLWRERKIIFSGQPGHKEVSEKNLKVICSHGDCICRLKVQYVYSYPMLQSILKKCKNLLSLELIMCRIGIDFQIDVKKWRNLRKLSLRNSLLLSNNVELQIPYDHFPRLNCLSLSDFGLNESNSWMLLNCNYLCHIRIEKIRELNVHYIKQLILSKHGILQTLHIYGGEGINDECLELLAQCPYLQDLAIVRCENLQDPSLVALAQCKQIKQLQIWNNSNFSEQALYVTLRSPKLIKLHSLSLSRISNISPIIVDVISEYYKDLKFLALYQCPRIINTDYEKQLKSKFRNIDVVLY